MKTITLQEVAACKREDIMNHEANRQYVGNAETDNRIQYIERMSDEDYMNMHNQVVARKTRKIAERKDKQAAVSAERKATGMSKKAYRAEYDRLMAEYKATKNMEAYKQAKSIAKFAF